MFVGNPSMPCAIAHTKHDILGKRNRQAEAQVDVQAVRQIVPLLDHQTGENTVTILVYATPFLSTLMSRIFQVCFLGSIRFAASLMVISSIDGRTNNLQSIHSFILRNLTFLQFHNVIW